MSKINVVSYMYKFALFMFFLNISILTPVQAAEDMGDKFRAINRPSTTPDVLEHYANDSNWEVRKAVASRQTTPANIMIKLASDPEYRVRAAVAHNLRAPVEALLPLVNDASSDVRLALAHCGYTPPDILEKLVNDPDAGVRKQLVLNPNLSMRILRNIAEGNSENATAASLMLKKRESEE